MRLLRIDCQRKSPSSNLKIEINEENQRKMSYPKDLRAVCLFVFLASFFLELNQSTACEWIGSVDDRCRVSFCNAFRLVFRARSFCRRRSSRACRLFCIEQGSFLSSPNGQEDHCAKNTFDHMLGISGEFVEVGFPSESFFVNF